MEMFLLTIVTMFCLILYWDKIFEGYYFERLLHFLWGAQIQIMRKLTCMISWCQFGWEWALSWNVNALILSCGSAEGGLITTSLWWSFVFLSPISGPKGMFLLSRSKDTCNEYLVQIIKKILGFIEFCFYPVHIQHYLLVLLKAH